MATISEIFGVGGPVAGLAALLFVIGRWLLDRRGAEVEADRKSESGIVESTKATLELMGDSQKALKDELRELRQENSDLRGRLSLKDEQVEKLRDDNKDLHEMVEELRKANGEMRRRLESLENWGGEVPPPPLESGAPMRPRDDEDYSGL